MAKFGKVSILKVSFGSACAPLEKPRRYARNDGDLYRPEAGMPVCLGSWSEKNALVQEVECSCVFYPFKNSAYVLEQCSS